PRKLLHLTPEMKTIRRIRLLPRPENERPNNHQVRAKEKTKCRRRNREKARRRTAPLLPRNRRKKNLPAKSKALEEITHKSPPRKTSKWRRRLNRRKKAR